jgi:hypothetical protein
LTLQTVNGYFLASAGELLSDVCACLCAPSHSSVCNGADLVPDTVHITFNFNGNTLTLPLKWIETSSACSGTEGWEYTGGRRTICTDLAVENHGISLCCAFDAPGVWHIGLALWVDGDSTAGNLQSYTSSPLGGLDTVVTVTTKPIDYTTQTTAPLATIGSGTHTLLVEATP